ncbi:MAG: hypothetical protein WC004_03865 [Candidatus Absconditabacterales bacterium]
MDNDRITLVGKELRRIKEEMSGRSREEIIQAMDEAYEHAISLRGCLSPETEELFVVFTLGWFMYAADIATTRDDYYRSRFAAIVYTKPFPKNERQKVKGTVFADPEPMGAKVK